MVYPYDDCWLPRPGSWEEAVDPYPVQARDEQRPLDERQMTVLGALRVTRPPPLIVAPPA
jgi:hypothetical protein